MTRTVSKQMDQKNICKFCGKSFVKLVTMNTHVCVKKRRYVDIDTAGSRFGLRTFQRFYELTMQSKQPKSVDEFINSPYYIDFVKFGNHLALLKPIRVEQYIDFVIMNNIKLKDWTKDFVYDIYINDLVKKEPAADAIERTIKEIIDWCDKNSVEFGKFFSSISANEASYLIKVGKISPWALYLADTGDDLMGRFNEDNSKMIGAIIDPAFWKKKFKKAEEDVDYIRSLLTEAKL